MTEFHRPVLVDEVLTHLGDAQRVVDCTVGGGGHSETFLRRGCDVLAIDRDPDALAEARLRLGDERIQYLQGEFGDQNVLEAARAFGPDGVLLDLGVSSHQLDTSGRGFSFRPGELLDMRMDPGKAVTAASLLRGASAAQLATWFREYADEPRARRLAATIVERRQDAPIRTSDDLVNAIRRALGPRAGPGDFARLFQAVRIVVNGELDQLEQALPALRDALVPRGRLLVISYHSGEDRIVKHTFRSWNRTCICPPRQPICTCRGRALGVVVTRKGLKPTADEVARNARARSAILRVFETEQ